MVKLAVKVTDNTWAGEVEVESLQHTTGSQLKQQLSLLTNIPPTCMNLICKGSVLKDDLTLESQKVTENAKVMLFKRATSVQVNEMVQEEKQVNRVEKIVNAAKHMAERTDGGVGNNEKYFFEIQNQDGKAIKLPDAERKALVMAMTLHDKARALMKEGDYKNALDILLASDAEFSKCSEMLLTMVDNYGYLNLDLVWTFFKLKDQNFLRDATHRLNKAQQAFERSHGKNMERLKHIKGQFFPELAIYLRLHLLQGIAAFHMGDAAKAQQMLWKADFEIKKLRVSDEDISQLCAMGFTPVESRNALRACERKVDQAITYLLEIKEKKRQQRLEEKRLAAERREQKKLGVTSDGSSLVNMQMLSNLVSMGFRHELVVEGLRQTNNNQLQTLNLLTQSPGILEMAIIARDMKKQKARELKSQKAREEKLGTLVLMGFEYNMAAKVLDQHGGDVERAAEELLTMPFEQQDVPILETTAGSNNNNNNTVTTDMVVENSLPQTSETHEHGQEDAAESEEEEEEEEENSNQEIERDIHQEILPTVSQDSEAVFIDMSLDEEFEALQTYLSYIRK